MVGEKNTNQRQNNVGNIPVQDQIKTDIEVAAATKMIIQANGKIGIGLSTNSNWDGDYNLYVKSGIMFAILTLI